MNITAEQIVKLLEDCERPVGTSTYGYSGNPQSQSYTMGWEAAIEHIQFLIEQAERNI